MRSLSLLLLFAATLAAAIPAAAQTTPRRPPADTVRFGTTRPAAGDSIAMAEYDEAEEEAQADEDAEGDVAARGEDEAGEDTVPVRPRSGPYSRASGTGPFSVQASGETPARPRRGEVVWLQGRAASPAPSDSARRDTARAGSGPRVASGASARRDTASAPGSRPARRDTASATGSRPARRDSASTARRPAARDTAAARRNGQSAGTTGGRTGSASAATTNAGGRTGSAPATSTSGARARTHTVASGETFFAIARRYGVTAAQLRAINPDVDQDALEVGDVLRLPAAARDSRASSGSASERTGSQGGSAQRRSHTVAAGETLFGISRRYGVTVDAIRQANELEGDALRTGQRLVIPPAR